MYELKSKNNDNICYFTGEHSCGVAHRNYKKITTITGKIITEKVSTKINIYLDIICMLRPAYDELVSMFKTDSKGLILTNIDTGETYSNLFINMEELKLEQGNLANTDENSLFYKGQIQLSEIG